MKRTHTPDGTSRNTTYQQRVRLGLENSCASYSPLYPSDLRELYIMDWAYRSRPAAMGSFSLLVVALAAALGALGAEAAASWGCRQALGSFYIADQLNLTDIASRFGLTPSDVTPYNNNSNPDFISLGSRISIPLGTCDRLSVEGVSYAAHSFPHVVSRETYSTIANQTFANLTTADWLQKVNSYQANRIPNGATINVTINCSCGDASVSRDYGFFETYPLRSDDNLTSVATAFGLSGKENLLQQFNPGLNFSAGTGIAFIPVKNLNGSYEPLPISKEGISGGAIAGISVAVVFVLLLLAICLYCGVYRKKSKRTSLLPSSAEHSSFLDGHAPTPQVGSAVPVANFTVDKSVEFSYEELAKATNDFSMTNKIGGGGFGDVYYAELRGEKAAIKKMDMQASKEFLAELKVLTHVHHLNLVRLIGYCTESSLFLVYEFIENGNLSEHLRGSGRDPLPWSARVQIALDSARGLEYIHEHTVPVYIHRDIKSANILIDKSFRAKVADFGLAKLTEVGSSSVQTRLVGTFGYMPPEYAQYGEASPKVDVYAFGVVLYELVSAKEAVVKAGSVTETRGLVAMFEDALGQPDPREELKKIVDPRLGDNYPIDSVHKMSQLAKACTHENPQLRPSMRSIVVALMTLSSSTEDWDVGSFYDNQALMNLLSGR